MGRVFNKTFTYALSLILMSGIAFGIEAEYKNSLIKIELNKTGESSYNIDLYTQKKFSEPAKIIKKSDLSYYILLPETKNAASQTAYNSADIRSISANLYPYAGADINNGYTKININTTKPLNFTINTKSSSNQTALAAPSNVTIASNENKAEAKVQKKNSDFQKDKIEKQATPPKAQAQQLLPKKEKEKEKEKEKKIQLPKIAVDKKPQQKQIKKPESQPKAAQEQKPIEKTLETKQVQPEIIEEIQPQIIEEFEQNELKEDEPVEDTSLLENQNDKLTFVVNKLKSIKSKMRNKLAEYGLSFSDAILMLIAGLFSFVVMLIILNRKPKNQARLKSRADLMDRLEVESLTPKKQQEEKPKNNGQYFVFENNIKQTGFCDPSSSIKRNYELSSYDPDLNENYHKAKVEPYKGKNSKQPESEYDIIQKILKEDSFIEITPDEFKQNEVKKQAPISSPIKKEHTVRQQEPTVLSSVEIAPERGFMCVSYNDNINLMGYIFDDVFALYNFNQPRLENYNIKFRLSEKHPRGASFIVKVDNTKMLIKVTKSSMTLEVAM